MSLATARDDARPASGPAEGAAVGDGDGGIRKLPLAALAASHTVMDVYGAFLTPIIALVLAPKLGFTESVAAQVQALFTGVLSVGQLAFGYLSDRLAGRWMAVVAPALTGLAAGGFLFAPSLPWLLVLVLAAAVGVAAFHPEGVALAAATGGTRAAAATGWFLAAGPIGLTAGPILITWAARRPEPPVWLLWGGVVTSMALWWALPKGLGAASRRRDGSEDSDSSHDGVLARVKPHASVLSRLVGISALRYLALSALGFGVPLVLAESMDMDRAVATAGWWLSLFLGAGAVGGIVGSNLLGRNGGGGRSANLWSMAAAAPLIVAVPLVPVAWGWLPLTAAGLALGWGTPILVHLGQRVAPGAAAFVSALLMGGAWSLGGPAAPILFEKLRAGWSSEVAVGALGVACLAAAGLAWALPKELDRAEASG